MDLTAYYQNIRQTRATMSEADVVVVSRQTENGGKAGVLTEVPPQVAAKMVVDGTATVAEADTAAEFRRTQAEAKLRAEKELAAARMPFSLVTMTELSRLREARGEE